MRSEPGDLDRPALADALERRWGVVAPHLEHLPVGFGAHHWQAVGGDGTRWFASADDLRARCGPAAGIPTPSPRRSTGRFGRRPHSAGLVGRLHAASGSVPPDLPGREDFVLPGRDELETALARLGSPWDGGPFSEPARQLLTAHAGSVRDRLGAYDLLAGRMREAPGDWVVTHGEPHSANVIRDTEGDLRLVDGDTALVAPRERDLWMVLDGVAANADALRLYRERWALAEICEYVSELRRPHEETEDTRGSWEILGEYLP